MLPVALAVFAARYVFSVGWWPSPEPVGASSGPWALMQAPGTVKLMLPLVLISKVFPLIRMVTSGVHSTCSAGSGLPMCPGSTGNLREDERLSFLFSTPQFRIIKS